MREWNVLLTTDRKRAIGWRELVDLPEWGIRGIEAKVDTGARTSSLHVENVKHASHNRVRFEVVLSRTDPALRIRTVAPIIRQSKIKSSTGHTQERLIIATRIRIGAFEREVEISLVSRQGMICRMLLGRKAIEGALVVDPARRYVLSRAEALELGVRSARRDGDGTRRLAATATPRKARSKGGTPR